MHDRPEAAKVPPVEPARTSSTPASASTLSASRSVGRLNLHRRREVALGGEAFASRQLTEPDLLNGALEGG